jgi:hypothetical protein
LLPRFAVSQVVRKSSKATIKNIVAMLKTPASALAFRQHKTKTNKSRSGLQHSLLRRSQPRFAVSQCAGAQEKIKIKNKKQSAKKRPNRLRKQDDYLKSTSHQNTNKYCLLKIKIFPLFLYL